MIQKVALGLAVAEVRDASSPLEIHSYADDSVVQKTPIGVQLGFDTNREKTRQAQQGENDRPLFAVHEFGDAAKAVIALIGKG